MALEKAGRQGKMGESSIQKSGWMRRQELEWGEAEVRIFEFQDFSRILEQLAHVLVKKWVRLR